jgi:hypothetical protein
MQINDGDMGEATIGVGFRKIADLLASGGRVVIGANEAIAQGLIVGKDGERCIAIKRRATRQEFVDAVAAASPKGSSIGTARAPFYYELELWDRVLEGADGISLGIRIRQQGKAGL